jgi:hypothetical protein
VNFLSPGVVASGDYAVSQNGTPNMSVNVAVGKAYVPNPSATMLYNTYLDAVQNVAISSNASGNPRIDAVVIKLDTATTPNNLASNIATIVVVQGTPAASPVAPSDGTIQTAVGAANGFYRLANVTVANGAVSITNANIASTRSVVTWGITPSNIPTSSIADAAVTSRKMKLDQIQHATSTTNLATTSTSYIDYTGLSVTFTPNVASNFLVLVQATSYNSQAAGSINSFIVTLDGATQGNDPLMVAIQQDNTAGNFDVTVSGFLWITGVSAASHTVKVRAKTSAGTMNTKYGSLTVIPFAS